MPQIIEQYPTNNALLINFRLSSGCRNFVDKHRQSMQLCARHARTRMQRVHIPTELPFGIPPLVVGYGEICRLDHKFVFSLSLSLTICVVCNYLLPAPHHCPFCQMRGEGVGVESVGGWVGGRVSLKRVRMKPGQKGGGGREIV